MITLLLGIALVLFFLEIFAPGGVLALIGVGLICAASIVAFIDYGPAVGLTVFVGGILGALLFFLIELKFVTQSSFGQRLFRHQQVSSGTVGLGDTTRLLGAEGVTATRMTPGGKVRIGDEIHTAVSIDGYLASGTPVVVKEADTFTIRVSTS